MNSFQQIVRMIFARSNTILVMSCCLILLIGCKTTRKAAKPLNLKNRSTKFLLKKLNNNKIEADWISAKARVTYADENETRKFTSLVRLRKDSVIWMNFKKTSIEAARILITPDSLFILNRLDKEYFKDALDGLKAKFFLPQSDLTNTEFFQIIQELILGNPVFYQVKALNNEIVEEQYYLEGDDGRIKSEYWLDGLFYRLGQLAFTDFKTQGTVAIKLDDYEELEDRQKFSYLRTITAMSEETGKVYVEIEFKKLEINIPKNIRFEIPSRYTRIQ